jgi:enamine deaminase RidA (YjgF/YER057c/UK114 family)
LLDLNVDRPPRLKGGVGRLPIDEPLESAGDCFALTITRQEKTMKRMLVIMMVAVAASSVGFSQARKSKTTKTQPDKPEYFMLRPEVERQYGYTHAVRIGNDLKISGAVSMDEKGNLVAPGNLEQQMKNCYADLEKILKHFGYTFADVVAENIYTTDMAGFVNVSGYRNSIYKKQFPTGTWLEVKGLALPGQLIEIDMEAHKTK